MSELYDLATQINTIKGQIKEAIRDKGITVSDNDAFSTYPNKISSINPTINTITITPTQPTTTVTAPSGVDGYSPITVEVTPSVDPDIIAENIKSGVNILGVYGTYNGDGDIDYGAMLRIEQIDKGGPLESVEDVISCVEQSIEDTLNGTTSTYTITLDVTPSTAMIRSEYYDKYLRRDMISFSNILTNVPVGTTIKTNISAAGYREQEIPILVEDDKTVTIALVAE